MAPEVCALYLKNTKNGYDYCADIFSMGALLYELVVGTPLFEPHIEGQDPYKYVASIFEREQKNNYKMDMIADANLKSFLQGLLMCDPTKRLGNNRNFSELLGHKFSTAKYASESNQNEEITDYIELIGFTKQEGQGVSNPFEVF